MLPGVKQNEKEIVQEKIRNTRFKENYILKTIKTIELKEKILKSV